MSVIDLELERLKKLETAAFERYMRLANPSGMPQHPELILAARDLWRAAAANVRDYRRKDESA